MLIVFNSSLTMSKKSDYFQGLKISPEICEAVVEMQQGRCAISRVPLSFDGDDLTKAVVVVKNDSFEFDDANFEVVCNFAAEIRTKCSREAAISLIMSIMDSCRHNSITFYGPGDSAPILTDLMHDNLTDTNKVLIMLLEKVRIACWVRDVNYSVDLITDSVIMSSNSDKILAKFKISDETVIVSNAVRVLGNFNISDPNCIEDVYGCIFGSLKTRSYFLESDGEFLEEFGA